MQRRSVVGAALVAVGSAAWLAVPLATATGRVQPRPLVAAVPFAVLFATGVIVWWLRPRHPAAWRLLLAGALLAVAVGSAVGLDALPRVREEPAGWLLGIVAIAAADLALAALLDLFCVFPDGRYPGLGTRLLARAGYALAIGSALLTALHRRPAVPLSTLQPQATVRLPFGGPLVGVVTEWPVFDQALFVLVPVAVAVMVLRYHGADAEGRARLRWPMAGVGVVAVALITSWVGVFDGLRLSNAAATAVWGLALSAIPIGVLVGMVHNRLFDLDLVVRRTASYAVLWALIAVLYAGVSAVPGVAAGRRLPPVVAVLLTIAVAMAFQPVRRRLERLADRRLFGERISGYALVRQFGTALETAVPAADLAPRLAATTREGLDAAWARVWVVVGDGSRMDLAAADGDPVTPSALATDLVAAGEPVGRLECGPRRRGRHTDADAELLDTLGRQAALALANSQLGGRLRQRLDELDAQAAELAASRARIVAAEAAGRRQLERDIHDGVQQQLVSLMTGLSVARTQLPHRPEEAAATLTAMQTGFRKVVADLRDLVTGIHPAVLTDQGLLAAVEALVARVPLPVSVDCAEAAAGRLEQQVEVAAYFGVAEALTNVLKHADAAHAWVRLARHAGLLAVEVGDDGRGFEVAAAPRRGLDGLRDRVEALDGTLVVASRCAGPTTVRILLPVGEGQRV